MIMLKNLISDSDIIEVDGKITLNWSLHPENGFECTTHSQTDTSVKYFYQIKNEDLNNAIVEGDYWVVSYTHNAERHNAKFQCFTKHLMKS